MNNKTNFWKQSIIPNLGFNSEIDYLEGLKKLLIKSKDETKIKDFKKKDISRLRFGIVHSLFGYPDGVSIVMGQIEKILNKNLEVPLKNIYYLVGKSKIKRKTIFENELLWDGNKINRLAINNYQSGYGGGSSELIELAINSTKDIIKEFINNNKIDILLAHNSCHPINFIYSIALSRYYRDEITAGRKTPKYLIWWHDSHLERKHFLNPPKDVENYLLQGIPGNFVEHIIFINNGQFKEGKKYFKKLDKRNSGFFHLIEGNHDTVYNTTDTFIRNFKDLKKEDFTDKVEKFLRDFKIKDLLKRNKLQLNDVLFVLQHTRLVNRKRIDFALAYCYELLSLLRKKGSHKAMYFLVSGQNADTTKSELIKLNKRLKKEYNLKNLFLVFAEEYYDKTEVTFEEYPRIFAKLGGISTYFSEVEGFGNNLLEVLASGLIPIIYTYPVFKSDIAKYGFKTIALDKFEIDMDHLEQTLDIIKNESKRKEWVNHNLKVLRKNFAHETMAVKLVQAITSKRGHK